ncbi:MAG: hypothetical protein CBD58_03535 [bacterium TMED198]|nr:MAG: hypothetical protein CBD58_03535 [bacterium TMED198]
MKEKVIDIDGVGPVEFRISQRARRINMSIKPPSTIRVSIPRRVSYERAAEFVLSKKSWIDRTLAKLKRLAESSSHSRPIVAEQAVDYLTNRINELSNLHGLPFNRLSIKSQKTLWGSCTSRNNINLNINLINLPRELIDYVIVHELVHTKVKNHGPKFWSMLNGLVDNARALDKKLKGYILPSS